MTLFRFLVVATLAFALSPFIASADVTVEITALVPGCGDGIIEPGEECDVSDFGGETCQTQGFNRGSLICTASCTIDTSACSLGSGGGGSPTPPEIPETNVVFSGRAYPESEVTILKDGQIVTTTVAEPDGDFSATISGLSTGRYKFTFFAKDKNGLVSSPFYFRTFINSEVTTKISDILLAPTIMVDFTPIARGQEILVFGQSARASEVTVTIDEELKFTQKVLAEDDGDYRATFDSQVLALGLHSVSSRTTLNGQQSPYSTIINFEVTPAPVAPPTTPPEPEGSGGERSSDINGDGRVNLIDFSILAFWYNKLLSNDFREIEREFFNGDGVVNLIDFSIMAFYWTG